MRRDLTFWWWALVVPNAIALGLYAADVLRWLQFAFLAVAVVMLVPFLISLWLTTREAVRRIHAGQ